MSTMLWNVMSGISLRATVSALSQMVDAPVKSPLCARARLLNDLGTRWRDGLDSKYVIRYWVMNLIKSLTHVEWARPATTGLLGC